MKSYRPHRDHSYLTVSVSPIGSGTTIEVNGETIVVPRGEIVIFSGTARQKEVVGVEALSHFGTLKDEDRWNIIFGLSNIAPQSPLIAMAQASARKFRIRSISELLAP